LEWERKREKELEIWDAMVITTLREAQPAVPQRITINNHKLSPMKETDNLESLVLQLEATLVSLKITRDDWKQYIHSQVAVGAKETIMHLFTDEHASYVDIRAGLLGCSALFFTTMAEALFCPMRIEKE